MTEEQINQNALEAYPEKLYKDCDENSYDDNENYRDGYIKALKEIEELPKIRGWVARNSKIAGNTILFFENKPTRKKWNSDDYINNIWTQSGGVWFMLNKNMFPDLTWESEPIEVELLIRKI